ncbi:MAG: hypothetical protein Tsb0027_11140 [Wenzhouxiangellaceae bacterium]
MYRLIFTLIITIAFVSNHAVSRTPSSLLIYYGFPSLINNSSGNLNLAIQSFSMYDYVVIGDCLQEDGSATDTICPHSPHPDHVNTVNIINHPSLSSKRFFGYIDLGVRSIFDGSPRQNLSIAEIQRRAQLWAAMGVDGILLDDFGYDFEVSRDRQRAAVSIIHNFGLAVIANGFRVDDVFSDTIDPVFNPKGLSPNLGEQDYYLYESHQIILGDFDSESNWQIKANALENFRQSLNFKILSITTVGIGDTFSEDQFFYAWHSAAMYEHHATGWGELFFSAGDNNAPFRIRPMIQINEFVSDINQQGSVYERIACNGLLSINAESGINSFDFTAGEFCLLFSNGFEN